MVDLPQLKGLSPDERVVEFHIHSNMSDGADPPEEVVRRAKRAGIRAISLTDHDTLAGLARAGAEAERLGMAFIPGAEVSCVHRGRSVHLLAHFIEPAAPRLAKRMEAYGPARVARMEEMIDRLRGCGLEVDKADFFAAYADSPSITRGQLGSYLLDKGLAASRAEVFERYIGDGAPGYVELEALSPFEGIELIRSAGGTATLAHPKSSACDDIIPAMSEAGLAGIEVDHPSQDEEAQSHYRRLAGECGLLCMGGSDSHGGDYGDELLARFPQPLGLLLELSGRAGQAERAGP